MESLVGLIIAIIVVLLLLAKFLRGILKNIDTTMPRWPFYVLVVGVIMVVIAIVLAR